MTFSTALRSPLFRVPFLAFAIFSSVATSNPDHHLLYAHPDPIDEDITLAPGASITRKIEYSANDVVSFEAELNGAASPGALLRIESTNISAETSPDASVGASRRNDCNEQWRFRMERSRWLAIQPDGSVSSPTVDNLVHIGGDCGTETGTLTFKVENEGASEIRLHLLTTLAIDVYDDTGVINAKVVP
jgi:hypothetical protein